MFIVCTFFIDTVIPTQQMNKLRLTEDTPKQATARIWSKISYTLSPVHGPGS